MSHLVMSNDLALTGSKYPTLLLKAGDDAFYGLREVIKGRRVCSAARRDQRCFVDKVREVGTGKAWRKCGNGIDIEISSDADLIYVNAKNVHTTLAIGPVDKNLTIEPSSTQKGRVKNFRAVRCGKDDDPGAGIKTIHLREQLVESLLLLVVTRSRKIDPARPAQRV